MRKVTIVDNIQTRYKDYALVVDKKRVSDDLKRGDIINVLAYGERCKMKIKGIAETIIKKREDRIKGYVIFVNKDDSDLIKKISFKGLEAEVHEDKGMNVLAFILMMAISIGCFLLFLIIHKYNSIFIDIFEASLRTLAWYGMIKYVLLILSITISGTYIIHIIKNRV